MTEKRYYKKDWEESYYIFDSNTISEDEFEEDIEYEGYDIFGYSLTGSEIIDLLNENEQLKEIIKLSCVMEICESCKYGKYWVSGYDFFGKEGEFECLKGHPSDECCEIMDCKDYEIKDLKELLEWVKR